MRELRNNHSQILRDFLEVIFPQKSGCQTMLKSAPPSSSQRNILKISSLAIQEGEMIGCLFIFKWC
jgi:hypothetical protein